MQKSLCIVSQLSWTWKHLNECYRDNQPTAQAKKTNCLFIFASTREMWGAVSQAHRVIPPQNITCQSPTGASAVEVAWGPPHPSKIGDPTPKFYQTFTLCSFLISASYVGSVNLINIKLVELLCLSKNILGSNPGGVYILFLCRSDFSPVTPHLLYLTKTCIMVSLVHGIHMFQTNDCCPNVIVLNKFLNKLMFRSMWCPGKRKSASLSETSGFC